MKKLISVLAILAVCLLSAVILFKCNNPFKKKVQALKVEHAAKHEAAVMSEIADHKDDTIAYYKSKWGREHAEKAQIQGDAAAIRVFYKLREDSLCIELGIKSRQLQGMYQANTEVEGTFTVPTKVESACRYSFVYEDSFMHEEGYVDSSTTLIHYDLTVPVTLTRYWKRHWLLGRKHYIIDGYSTNPKAHITGLEGVSIN